MHVPDGFIAPLVYLPAYGLSAGLWSYGARRVKRQLSHDTLPQLAVLTALSFVLMMVSLPLPGGSSVHFTGVALLAVLFGVWTSFLCVSMVFLLQSMMFAAGGITALPINALAVGLVGAALAVVAFKALRRWNLRGALFVAGWLSVVAPSILVATVLGLQPALAHSAQGMPLFFPFGLRITLPALVLPHCALGVAEGALTVVVHGMLQRLNGESTS